MRTLILTCLVGLLLWACHKPVEEPPVTPPAQVPPLPGLTAHFALATPVARVALNLQDRGVRPEGSPEANSAALEALLASYPEGATPSLYAPWGDYRFARTIRLYRRPVHLFGDSGTPWGKATRFIFPAGVTGILVERDGTSIQETVLEHLALVGGGPHADQADGLALRARAKVLFCSARGFSGTGFGLWANMEEGADGSGSLFLGCNALENGRHGFFAGRVDANAVLFINCDARDNAGVGFVDDSFLGNNFLSCMAHYNKGGDFYVRDKGNARSTFVGCYSEGGNAKLSELGPHATVVGGIWGTGFTQN